jgi:ribosomal protein S18 acetylase RimI-like enzyme
MTGWTIERLDGVAAHGAIPELAEVLVDCVEGGASVSFLAPLSLERAAGFWAKVAAEVASGERALLVARDPGRRISGTVNLVLAQPENQPHRADVTKLLVHRRARRSGAGERLMREIEAVAVAEGKTLLVLDTASGDARRIYERCGWQLTGCIPNYALNPDRTVCDTWVYWKDLAGRQSLVVSH